jgi:hypothetical protein
METADYQKMPCPKCQKIGGIAIDPRLSRFFCKHCSAAGFDPFKSRLATKTTNTTNGGYSPPPTGAKSEDQIVEFAIVRKNGLPERQKIHTIYYPKQYPQDTPFNSNDPWFKFHLHLGLAEEGQKRRRRNRDITNRALSEGRTATTRWIKEIGR